MQNECVFSEDRLYRYSLVHRWERELLREYHARPVMWCGLNPSKADEIQLDNTLRRVRAFSDSWGFDSFVMTNLFAWRATDPKAMKKVDSPIGPLNDFTLLQTAARCEYVVCAWGCDGAHRNRVSEVMELLKGFDLRRLAVTKNGFARHCLYLANGAQPLKIDAS